MSNEQELREQRDEEAWKHAACLTIAETGQKWGDDVEPSLAMRAVYNLHQSRNTWMAQTKALRDMEQRYYTMLRTPPDLVPWRMTVWRIGYSLSQVDWQATALTLAIVGGVALLALGLAWWAGWGAVAGVAFGMFVVFVFAYLK